MKNQRGSAALWVLLGVVFLLVSFVMYAIGHYNSAVRIENNIAAKYQDNQNVLSSYTLKIGEMAQIPEMYSNDLRRVITEALDARYGDTGSKAMFQWIQEQNPTLDVSVYKAIQVEMVAGRNAFQNSQTQLLDVCRTYSNQLDYAVGGTVLRILGFPRAGTLDKKCVVIISKHAKQAYETGIDEGIKLKTDVDEKIDSKEKF